MRLILIFAGVLTGLSFDLAAANAPAVRNETAPSTACAERYHGRLLSHAAPLAHQTQEVADAVRSMRATDMPGRWLFWDGSGIAARNAYQQRLLATPLINRKANLICKRQILARGGRIRCMQWKPIPADYSPSPPKPTVDPTRATISPAERQFAAQLAPWVIHKGRFVQIYKGTALYHILQRTTDELIGYTTQPFRETMCGGALEMVGFYRRRLSRLRSDAEKSASLKRATRTAARATTQAVLRLAHEPEMELPELISVLLANSLTKRQEPSLSPNAEAGLFRQLQRGRDLFSDARISAAPAGHYAGLLKAWRQVEFALYARHQNRRIQRLAATFAKALNEIEQAHNELCTCTN